MKVLDERSSGPRRNLYEVGLGAVVVLDDRKGFWMRVECARSGPCRFVHLGDDGVETDLPRHIQATLVEATVTITGA